MVSEQPGVGVDVEFQPHEEKIIDKVPVGHRMPDMLLPRTDSAKHLAAFEEKGVLELGGARLTRQGKAAVLTMRNPRYLNAEDETTLEGMEIAVDVALLDRKSELCVLRGDVVTHNKHAGRRVFGAGINLTHLYQGKIRYLWYLIRDLGLVNKFYRGLALPGVHPEEDSIEKPWVAAVESFAIGGHCQILLAMDYVLAARDAYMTLPARKEGIIPGAARAPRVIIPAVMLCGKTESTTRMMMMFGIEKARSASQLTARSLQPPK